MLFVSCKDTRLSSINILLIQNGNELRCLVLLDQDVASMKTGSMLKIILLKLSIDWSVVEKQQLLSSSPVDKHAAFHDIHIEKEENFRIPQNNVIEGRHGTPNTTDGEDFLFAKKEGQDKW